MSDKNIYKLLSKKDLQRLKKSAEEAQAVENQFIEKLDKQFEEITEQLLQNLERTGRVKESIVDFEDFFMEHLLETTRRAIKVTQQDETEEKIDRRRLAMPRSLKDLMVLWDQWRKKGKVSKKQKAYAEKVKKAYIKKVQSVWQRYSESFRNGDEVTKEEIANKIRKAAKTVQSRAKTIVNTETTRYYNQTREAIYNQDPDITHYLFMAVRDHATTPWCAPGKGRHGIVYEKGSDYLQRERPPCHWNCRSELLPLSPLNPSHRKLIKDKSIQRENRRPTPLPPGWNS